MLLSFFFPLLPHIPTSPLNLGGVAFRILFSPNADTKTMMGRELRFFSGRKVFFRRTFFANTLLFFCVVVDVCSVLSTLNPFGYVVLVGVPVLPGRHYTLHLLKCICASAHTASYVPHTTNHVHGTTYHLQDTYHVPPIDHVPHTMYHTYHTPRTKNRVLRPRTLHTHTANHVLVPRTM